METLKLATKQTHDVEIMLVLCWASVIDDGQTVNCTPVLNGLYQLVSQKAICDYFAIKTHHYIICLVRSLHSKSGMESYC